MRHNFVNDIGDYAKYALLRAICAASRTPLQLGVLWYLTDHDESNGNGRRRPHLSREGWETLDPPLLTEMVQIERSLTDSSDLHLRLVEQSMILPPGTQFFSEPVPSDGASGAQRLEHRTAWFEQALQAMGGCGAIFLDPDNGLEVASVGRASREAAKYVTVDEIAKLLATGAGVVLYQHCDRSPWPVQRERIRNQLADGISANLTIRSLRFGAFGARAFFCISSWPHSTEVMDIALSELQQRVATWDKARYLLVE